MCLITGYLTRYGPQKWSPRAILKEREVKPQEFERCHIKLMVLRAEIEDDWEEIDDNIWVKQIRHSGWFIAMI